MAHNIVRLIEKFCFAKTAYIDELVVDVGNFAFDVRFGHDHRVIVDRVLDIDDWQI